MLVQLSHDSLYDRAIVLATGPEDDVESFNAELKLIVDKVYSTNHAVPSHVISSKTFLELCSELNNLPETVVSVYNKSEAVQMWSKDASNLVRFRKEVNDLLRTYRTDQSVVSVPLSNIKNQNMFNVLRVKPGKHVWLHKYLLFKY